MMVPGRSATVQRRMREVGTYGLRYKLWKTALSERIRLRRWPLPKARCGAVAAHNPGGDVVVVRVATGGDAIGVAQAHVRSWQVGYEGLIAQSYLDALCPEDRARRYGFDQMNPEGPFTQVAVDGETICGHVTTGVSRDPDRQGDGEIWAIYVDPVRWRNGIGRILVQAGCEQLRSQGHDRACLWVLSGNVRARRFYEATGWQWNEAERTDTVGGGVVHEVRYERTLPAAYAPDDGAGLPYRGATLVESTAENDMAGTEFVARADGAAAETAPGVRRLR